MNAQIIHQSKMPSTVGWLVDVHRLRAERLEVFNTFAQDISERYDQELYSTRNLQVRHGLVGGFSRLYEGEPAPDGWLVSEPWAGFIPDVTDSEGQLWQSRIDNLPVIGESFDSTEVGIPAAINVSIDGAEPSVHFPSLILSSAEDIVYATWDDRRLLPAIKMLMSESNIQHDFGWVEMPRSEWYGLLETNEAIADMEDLADL
jgi:hypothetical protein